MSLAAGAAAATPMSIGKHPSKCCSCTDRGRITLSTNEFPSFLPKQVENVKDLFARKMASRIQRLPVEVNIMYFRVLFRVIMCN